MIPELFEGFTQCKLQGRLLPKKWAPVVRYTRFFSLGRNDLVSHRFSPCKRWPLSWVATQVETGVKNPRYYPANWLEVQPWKNRNLDFPSNSKIWSSWLSFRMKANFPINGTPSPSPETDSELLPLKMDFGWKTVRLPGLGVSPIFRCYATTLL